MTLIATHRAGNYTPISRKTRIAGGKEAVPGSWPWQVLLTTSLKGRGDYICGGTIIDENFILTAAHCLVDDFGKYVEWMGIVAGEHSRNISEGFEQNRNVSRNVTYPNYNGTEVMHDIALIQLNKPLTFNERVRKVTLPKKDDTVPRAGATANVAGWGYVDRNQSKYSDILKEAEVPIIDGNLCLKEYKFAPPNCPNIICAGSKISGVDSCAGDSGGPLMVAKESGQFVQYGITSFGPEKCSSNVTYGAYTNIIPYIDWITKTMAPARKTKHLSRASGVKG